MASSPVEEIKSRLDIVEIIGSYIKLQKAGRNLKARCPFHSEKSPSFMVSPERQIWHCFGCGQGGDIFAFVRQIEGVEFGDALRTLARRAGVVLKRQDPTLLTKRKRLYEVCELAVKFFEKQLEASKAGQKALKYLKDERGLEQQTIKEWRLGWAPDEWQALSSFLRQRGYNEQEIYDSGLTVKKEPTTDRQTTTFNSYDRFRSRIMFPIFDIQGQPVGFAGRIFGKEDPSASWRIGKYINTPQTALYDKSRLLYGLNFAKMDLRSQNACVLVEGNLDVIMSHQAGAKNAVASSGTALTIEHLKIIKRYADNLIFSFDTDLAGDTATKRSIDLAMENDFNIKVAQIKEKDPADLIKQNPKDWEQAIISAVSIMDFYFDSAFAKHKKIGPEEKKGIAAILLPAIKRIPNQIEQAHWVGELAKKLHTEEKNLYAEMRKIKNASLPMQDQETASPPKIKTRAQDLEERILSLCLSNPEHLEKITNNPESLFFNAELVKMMEEFKIVLKENPPKEKCLDILKDKLPANMAGQIDFLCLRAEQYPLDDSLPEEEINSCARELEILKIKDQMNQLAFEIQDAHNLKNKEKLNQIMEKFKSLSNQLTELKK